MTDARPDEEPATRGEVAHGAARAQRGKRRMRRAVLSWIALYGLALVVAMGLMASPEGYDQASSNAGPSNGMSPEREETLHRMSTAAKARATGLSCGKQSGTLRLCGAITDNYKQCFNSQVSRETRTWLNWTSVTAKGAVYRTAPGQAQFSSRLNLRRVRGTTSMPAAAYITLRVTQNAPNVRVVTERTDFRTHRVGPLVDYKSMYSLSKRPIAYLVILRRSSDGKTLATASIVYRYEQALAGAPASSPEHLGPGGRWYVNGSRTITDVEAGTFGGC